MPAKTYEPEVTAARKKEFQIRREILNRRLASAFRDRYPGVFARERERILAEIEATRPSLPGEG